MRNDRFTFVCDRDERQMLAAVSAKLARTQSDAVRFLIREAARDLPAAQGSPGVGRPPETAR